MAKVPPSRSPRQKLGGGTEANDGRSETDWSEIDVVKMAGVNFDLHVDFKFFRFFGVSGVMMGPTSSSIDEVCRVSGEEAGHIGMRSVSHGRNRC